MDAGVAGRFDLGVRRVALPSAGVSPVVLAALVEVAEGRSPSEKRTRLDARLLVGVAGVVLVLYVGLMGDMTLARRLVRWRAIGSADLFVDGSMLRCVEKSGVVKSGIEP